jgi:hypothetical protein
MSATIIAFRPKPQPAADDTPRREWGIDGELWDAVLGMTSRQSEMAVRLRFKNPGRNEATSAALCRYYQALRDFEPALAAYREELLKNMDMFCPRAAKRIRDGKPPRRRQAKGPVRSVVDEAESPR